MEEFKKINWNPVDTTVEPFVTLEYLKERSCLYKVLNDKNFSVFSSDSSDSDSEEAEEKESDKRNNKGQCMKNKNKKKKDGNGVNAAEMEKNGNTQVGKNKSVIEHLQEEAVGQPSGDVIIGKDTEPNYTPGFGLRLRLPRKSSLNTMEHSEYLRLMMKWKDKPLPTFLSLGQQRDLQTYNLLKEVVMKEQVDFLAYAKSQWPRLAVRCNVLNVCVQRYVEEAWQHRLCRVFSYPRFYSAYGQPIPLVYAPTRPDVQLDFLQSLLELGELPRLVLPCLKSRTKVCTDYSKMTVEYPPGGSEQEPNSLYKVPVSKDKNAEYLAGVHGADVVISSGGLQTIINNLVPFDKVWDIPVTVKEIKYRENGALKQRKVVFVDKALAPKTMTVAERNIWYHKLGVRMLVCHYGDTSRDPKNNTCVPDVVSSATSSAATSEAANICNNPPEVSKVDNIHEVKIVNVSKDDGYYDDDDDDDDSDSDNLMIDYNSDSEREDQPEHETDLAANTSLAELSLSSSVGTTSQWLPQTAAPMNSPEKLTPSLEVPDKTSTHHTKLQESLIVELPVDGQYTKMQPAPKTFVAYRLWKLSPMKRNKEDLREDFLKGIGSCRDIKLLVRCKVDACEEGEETSHVCVFPKLENQYEFGAEALTPTEVVSQWTALQFRPNCKLARVRVDALTSEVMMTETVSQQSLMAEALQHQFRVRSSSLGTLYSVLSHLVDLPVGCYLLSHTARSAGFVNLLSHQPDGGEYDLHLDYSHVDTKKLADEVPPWIPIDTHLVAPVDKALKHIPATFLPRPYKVPVKPRPRTKHKHKHKKKKQKGK
ncbi:little elongation complex subunit 2 [Anabrus simplex]|uniref:little elongation complex subunit 2 n=1 Tax=Anabrus simplex TaxID=316456 RepID=UPI0035A2FB79